jgi:hypothetical protein
MGVAFLSIVVQTISPSAPLFMSSAFLLPAVPPPDFCALSWQWIGGQITMGSPTLMSL